MEVVLKKSKITNSIIKQTLIANISDLTNSDVLGWCLVDKKIHYIVLYNSSTNELRKYLMINKISFDTPYPHQYDTPNYLLTINFGVNYIEHNYKFDTLKEVEDFKSTLERIKTEALTKGQFYL